MTEIFSKNGVSVERLQTLAKVVRAGSIALAAKGNPNAQSLISRQLGELEKTLGLELLDRKQKSVILIPPHCGLTSRGGACTLVRDVCHQACALCLHRKHLPQPTR